MQRSILLLCLACVSTNCTAADFLVLAEKVPQGANAVMAIDVAQALASPMAKKNGWDKKINEGGFDRPIHLPPEASKLLTVAQIDIVRSFGTNWKASLFDLTESIPMRLVARAEGGYSDNIQDFEAVWIPSDAYVIDRGDNVLGMQSPADRQAIVRWNAQKPSIGNSVSDYLAKSLVRAGKGPQIVLALDIENAVQPHRVRTGLKQSGFAKDHQVDEEDLLTLILSLKGVSLEITLADSAQARTQIDFNTDVKLNTATARALVTAAMEGKQMSLPEFEKHKLLVVGKSIILEGELDAAALRRIMSIMVPASTKFSSLKDENVDESSGDDMAKNSLAYFKSVQSYLKDLKNKSGSSGSDAHWIDRYATVIDKLPILHVDDDLLDYGQKLTETLRLMSGSRKKTRMEGGVAARNNYTDGGYGYNNYNYRSAGSQRMGAASAKATATASGSMAKIQGFNLIDNATNEIRKEMTKRYDIEF